MNYHIVVLDYVSDDGRKMKLRSKPLQWMAADKLCNKYRKFGHDAKVIPAHILKNTAYCWEIDD